MKIILLKLITGVDIIGQTESDLEQDEIINIENPLEAFQGMSTNGNIYIHYSPFLPHSEEKLFTFKSKDIITYCKPNEYLLNYYNNYLKELENNFGKEVDNIEGSIH